MRGPPRPKSLASADFPSSPSHKKRAPLCRGALFAFGKIVLIIDNHFGLDALAYDVVQACRQVLQVHLC
jgi:hypothetical protein